MYEFSKILANFRQKFEIKKIWTSGPLMDLFDGEVFLKSHATLPLKLKTISCLDIVSRKWVFLAQLSANAFNSLSGTIICSFGIVFKGSVQKQMASTPVNIYLLSFFVFLLD